MNLQGGGNFCITDLELLRLLLVDGAQIFQISEEQAPVFLGVFRKECPASRQAVPVALIVVFDLADDMAAQLLQCRLRLAFFVTAVHHAGLGPFIVGKIMIPKFIQQ